MELEVEKKTYEKHLASFREEHRHEWVVISGEDILDFFKSFETAALMAIQTYGQKPFMIQQIDAGPIILPFLALES